jgi:hypothetical protein
MFQFINNPKEDSPFASLAHNDPLGDSWLDSNDKKMAPKTVLEPATNQFFLFC